MARYLIALVAVTLCVVFPSAGAQAQKKAISVQGTWKLSMHGKGSAVLLQTLALEQKGDAISGTLKAPQGNAVPLHGKVTGQNIAFDLKRQTPDGEVTQAFAGTVSGDLITGTVTQGQIHVEFAAARATGTETR